MSVIIRLPGPLREFAQGRSAIELNEPVGTAGEALRALRRLYPAVHDRIVNEQGEVRPHVNVFVGNNAIQTLRGLSTPLEDGVDIVILPAVSGG